MGRLPGVPRSAFALGKGARGQGSRLEDGTAESSTGAKQEEPAAGGGEAGDRNGASSLGKMLSILDLFSEAAPVWSTADIIESLGASRSTGYRYVKTLNAAGLLSAVGNGYYMLGPRIIELDLQIRSTDPLLKASAGLLDELVNATGHSALLCMLFQNSVLCIDERLAPLSPERLFKRGQRRPLFRGAMSRVILAYLPNHRLRTIYARRQSEILQAGLGATWEEFRTGLAKNRSDGYVKSVGEFNPGIVGLAAPIFSGSQDILGSIGIACRTEELQDTDLNRTVIAIKRAGREVTQRMEADTSLLGLPPRAVG
jgi:DNA-binding IclR family transcriptional regulator